MAVPDWLRARLSEAPAPLRERLETAIAEVDLEAELSRELLATATRRLEAVRERLNDRESAFELLVADGLLTLACEAAAFSDPHTVAERCREMGPGGELGRVAARWLGRS